jgi:voltage-gated sodium channel
MFEHSPDAPVWRRKIEAFVNSPTIQHFIVFLIVLNAILLGLETNAEIVERVGKELMFIDHGILLIFTLEIVLLMASRGLR